ncbi:hypothetical protein NDU88_009590 [Pleurodeles waltl]|uniref:Uncharacterized protein n=1 Tax=Pleurodeles waltl TaxID=8319 RepID=A0AAV7PSX2_PLEWA|nr:hypothetical protein NDU88_009590 [Pleurodeles waltl]
MTRPRPGRQYGREEMSAKQPPAESSRTRPLARTTATASSFLKRRPGSSNSPGMTQRYVPGVSRRHLVSPSVSRPNGGARGPVR